MTSVMSWPEETGLNRTVAPRLSASPPSAYASPIETMPTMRNHSGTSTVVGGGVREGRRGGWLRSLAESRLSSSTTIEEEEEEEDDDNGNQPRNNDYLYLPSPHSLPASPHRQAPASFAYPRRRGSLGDLRQPPEPLNSALRRRSSIGHHRSLELLLVPRQNSLPTIPEAATPLSPNPAFPPTAHPLNNQQQQDS